MRKITLIVPYYENPHMFRIQQEGWLKWSPYLKAHTEIIVVDDGSKNHPAVTALNDEIVWGCGLVFRLFRILEDIPWNWITCRNIGAHEAEGDWLMMTDIDHIVTSDLLHHLHKMATDPQTFYVPSRVNGPDHIPNPKPHPNSYFMSKEFFWDVGGYDETYSGNYGTDGIWRRRCEAKGQRVMLPIPLVQYLPEHVPDCCSSLPRKSEEQRAAVLAITEAKRQRGEENIIKTLSFLYERVI